MYLFRHDLYFISAACGLEKMCNECYVCHTCVLFIFIRTMHARMKIFDVMPLYLFLCDISSHMHHGFTLSHTHALHGCNDLGGVSYMFYYVQLTFEVILRILIISTY
jgi:hypothetical protein